jgi:hypothetical protein
MMFGNDVPLIVCFLFLKGRFEGAPVGFAIRQVSTGGSGRWRGQKAQRGN